MNQSVPEVFTPLLTRLFTHLAWADEVAVNAVQAIPPGTAEQERAEAIYAHLAAVEHVWLARLRGEAARYSIWPSLDLKQARLLGRETATQYTAYIGALDSTDPIVTYVNTSGVQFISRATDILAHVALHGSYHRGQLALLARQGGSSPAVTEYIAFVRSAEPVLP